MDPLDFASCYTVAVCPLMISRDNIILGSDSNCPGHRGVYPHGLTHDMVEI